MTTPVWNEKAIEALRAQRKEPMKIDTSKKVTTLRELYDLVSQESPECLDSPMGFFIVGQGVNQAFVELKHDLWSMPRMGPNQRTGETGQFRLRLYMDKHRLVKSDRK